MNKKNKKKNKSSNKTNMKKKNMKKRATVPLRPSRVAVDDGHVLQIQRVGEERKHRGGREVLVGVLVLGRYELERVRGGISSSKGKDK